MIKRILRRIISITVKNRLKRAYKDGFEEGCLRGYRECEANTSIQIMAIKNCTERNVRKEMEKELLKREAKGYEQGLKDAGFLSQGIKK